MITLKKKNTAKRVYPLNQSSSYIFSRRKYYLPENHMIVSDNLNYFDEKRSRNLVGSICIRSIQLAAN